MALHTLQAAEVGAFPRADAGHKKLIRVCCAWELALKWSESNMRFFP